MSGSNRGFYEPCWRPDYIDRETGKSVTRFEHDPPAENVSPEKERVTHFVCKHPYLSRRTYVLDDAWVEVCRECCSARSERKDDYWESTCRLNYPDGSLRTLDGEILYRNWETSRNK
jgi:hypothetical protein